MQKVQVWRTIKCLTDIKVDDVGIVATIICVCPTVHIVPPA